MGRENIASCVHTYERDERNCAPEVRRFYATPVSQVLPHVVAGATVTRAARDVSGGIEVAELLGGAVNEIERHHRTLHVDVKVGWPSARVNHRKSGVWVIDDSTEFLDF
ncbi:hypothetical protein [Candidatus Poriferisodalis sp.]|uniref:hypothetical protein n=1 Tax=Candidatus Poriferisodalis sp. TaxID=3101277 RepID=UPI003B5BF7BD